MFDKTVVARSGSYPGMPQGVQSQQAPGGAPPAPSSNGASPQGAGGPGGAPGGGNVAQTSLAFFVGVANKAAQSGNQQASQMIMQGLQMIMKGIDAMTGGGGGQPPGQPPQPGAGGPPGGQAPTPFTPNRVPMGMSGAMPMNG